MNAVMSIRFAGPYVSVQDAGRAGFARFGVPQSGAMDRLAQAAALDVLGQPQGAAVEVSLGGLQLECLEGEVSFAVAGGGFIVDHDGQKGGSWQVATLRVGQRLTLRRGPWGAWCYLAFAGVLQVPDWLGSQATHSQSGLGGGRLETGGRVVVTGARVVPDRVIPCPTFARPLAQVRAVLGPQDRFFGADQIAALQGGVWRLTAAYDRMGVRLDGPKLAVAGVLDMPSEPVARGSVQVAGDGVATVLLADHQTTGGYPKIATVLDCDLDRFSQMRPGDGVQIALVTPELAVQAARLAARQRGAWLDGLTSLQMQR